MEQYFKDKISYEERWQVIHYIRSLQAKEKKLEYSEEANTLNSAYGTPGSQFQVFADQVTDEGGAGDAPAAAEEGEGGDGGDHDEGSHDGDGHDR